MIATIVLIVLYLATGFFTVRMTVLEFADEKTGEIDAGTWGFALLFGFVMAFIGYFVVLFITTHRRQGHFLPPKSKRSRERRPVVREALGKAFVIREQDLDSVR